MTAISATPASTGFKALANACDSHIHVFDSRFNAFDGSPTKSSAIPEYRGIQKQMGTSRVVIVTPRPYVTDNRCTFDAIEQLGIDNARGIAVMHPTITDAELRKLNDGGIRGIRFTLGNPKEAVTRIDMVEPLAKRIKPLGWHIQFHMLGDQIVEHEDLFKRLDLPMVFDHMCRLPPTDGPRHAAFQVVKRLLDEGNTWVKLSGSILHDSGGRRPPKSDEMMEIALAFIKAAPERLVWGSDWPHRGNLTRPDDAQLIADLGVWAQDEATRRRILVDNPVALYGFPA